MKLSDIRGKSLAEIASASSSQQREMWGYMRRVLKSRFKTFEKHGLGEAIPRRFRDGVATVRQLEKEGALAREISRALGYLEGKTSTARGYAAEPSETQTRFERMLGHPLSPKEYAELKAFLDEMATRIKETWKYVSDEAFEMFEQSKRLGIGLEQFKKNYDYWVENVMKLRESEKIITKKGKPAKLSTYIRRLPGLPSITSWKKQQAKEQKKKKRRK